MIIMPLNNLRRRRNQFDTEEQRRNETTFRRVINGPINFVVSFCVITFLLSSLVVAGLVSMGSYFAYQLTKPIHPLIRPVVDKFYAGLRFALRPLKFLNDKFEQLIIRSIINNKISARTGKYIVGVIFGIELVIGSLLISALFIAPIALLLTPIIGGVLSGVLYSAMCFYNCYKLSSWMTARIVNFSLSLLNLEWRENWLTLENLESVFNQLLNLLNHYAGIQTDVDPAPASVIYVTQSGGRFAEAWEKAIETRDISGAMKLLNTPFSANGKIMFTTEMQRDFDTASTRTLCSPEAQSALESSHKELCCPLSESIMQIPVYLEFETKNSAGVTTKGRHYFDFIYLLKALERENRNPLSREVIKDLKNIKFDESKYNYIQALVKCNHALPAGLERRSVTSDVKCGITNSPTRDPVYVTGSDGVRYYYDLIPLLNLMSQKVRGIPGITEDTQIQDLTYDHALRDITRVTNSPSMLVSGGPVRTNNRFDLDATETEPDFNAGSSLGHRPG